MPRKKPRMGGRRDLPGPVAEAVEAVRRQACSGRSVSEIAEALAVSERWLRAAFRRHVGHSPNREIQRVRLAEARRLLEATDLSITEIGRLVGFATTAALTSFFRRLTGVSPSEHRERSRRGANPPVAHPPAGRPPSEPG